VLPRSGRRAALLMSAVIAFVAVSTGESTSAATSDAKPSWTPGPEKYGVVKVQNVPIPMDDGVNLMADIDYPADKATGGAATGTFPVLLAQHPYGCQTPSTDDNSYLVSRGYIFARVCVRGTGRSGGTFSFIGPREQRDGVALVDWAAHRLRGSNGVVGLAGGSFSGLTQWLTAGALPPNSPVKALAPTFSGASSYRESATAGGVPTETMQYLLGIAGLMGPRAGAFGAKTFAEFMAGADPAYDGTFWGQRNPANGAAKIAKAGIPALMWTGWEDIFNRTSQEMYAYLQNAAAGRPVYGPMDPKAPVSPKYQIVVAPGGHGTPIDNAIILQWYDTWLKGMDTPFRRTRTPMHLYELGTNRWTKTTSYPMTNRYTRYYLGADGALAAAAPKARAADTLEYAPAQASSLTYTTPAFAKGATLAGPISATITASSSGTNLHVIASLFDVAPDGTKTYVTQGSLAGSFASYDKARTWHDANGVDINPYPRYDYDRWLRPGKPVELHITISPRLYAVAPGHKLQVVLTSQEHGKCSALLGWRPCFPTATQLRTFPGTYSILRGAGQQSTINIPLLPPTFFKKTSIGPGPTA
jgi:predicted acyl esterase